MTRWQVVVVMVLGGFVAGFIGRYYGLNTFETIAVYFPVLVTQGVAREFKDR